MEGIDVIAKCLKDQGITTVFGIVGVPVTPLAAAMQKQGIKFIGMRNEQAASYAASCVGYLLQKPAVCLTVAGPGMVHAIPGLLNATTNCWPMILISSAAWTSQLHHGSFQEGPQIEAARLYTKYAARVETIESVGYHIEQAARRSVYGRPGAVYIEIAREVIASRIEDVTNIFPVPYLPPPRTYADPSLIQSAVHLLQDSQSPLIVIGRGAAYSRAEDELQKIVEVHNFPFLPSPMGKGVISDEHPLCVSAARTLALGEADVVLLVGARLNWMFNFGQEPGISKKAKIIQIDISAEELHTNRQADIALQGDAKAVITQLLQAMSTSPKKERDSWWKKLREKCQQNSVQMEKKSNEKSKPMKYHYVLSTINSHLPKDAIIINEGANTMDIGRVTLTNHFPRSRLDAGTLGTMGVGLGYTIAAAVVHPQKKVVAIEGDSAFGFSGLEIEVAVRYKLKVTIFVLNNNGIYCGQEVLPSHDPLEVPATSLTPNTRYDLMMDAFGGKGFYVEEPELLPGVIKEALAYDGPSLVNIVIDPHGPTPSVVANATKPNIH